LIRLHKIGTAIFKTKQGNEDLSKFEQILQIPFRGEGNPHAWQISKEFTVQAFCIWRLGLCSVLFSVFV